MTPDTQKVENAYLDAISILADIIGLHDEDDGMIREPSVDLDRLPAPVITAGRYAISMLAVGAGCLTRTRLRAGTRSPRPKRSPSGRRSHDGASIASSSRPCPGRARRTLATAMPHRGLNIDCV
jgi:hypothetical protein